MESRSNWFALLRPLLKYEHDNVESSGRGVNHRVTDPREIITLQLPGENGGVRGFVRGGGEMACALIPRSGCEQQCWRSADSVLQLIITSCQLINSRKLCNDNNAVHTRP